MYETDSSNCIEKNINKWKGIPNYIDYKAVSSTEREFIVRYLKISVKILMLPKMEDFS